MSTGVERLSIQMVEQLCTTKIQKLLIDPHAFGSMLGNETCEESKEDEESREILILVEQVRKIDTYCCPQ